MSLPPPSQSTPARPGPRGLLGLGSGSGNVNPGRRWLPVRLMVAFLALLLLFGTATHLEAAIKAGLGDGTKGTWIATSQTCVHKACTWNGKFVAPGGQVLLSKVSYDGKLPASISAGTSVPALDTGGAGLVFPATGSDLWISLLIAFFIALGALYWASHRWVADFIRQRRSGPAVQSGLPHS